MTRLIRSQEKLQVPKVETPVGQEREMDEICAICDQFGYNNEVWWQCRSCATWAHADCTSAEKAAVYISEFCSG